MDVFSLPRVDDVIDALRDAQIFSTLDLMNTCRQISIASENMEKKMFWMAWSISGGCSELANVMAIF